ncbi:MAG: IscA/HesB family protein [Desulfoprunum sp.]|nr:IscA/HesB family protein [Desulfoprunum sp.]
MLEVSDLAVTKVKEYLVENNITSAVRVAIMSGGCSGPVLSLALDEKKDSDKVFEYDGLNFLVDGAVVTACGAIKVDYVQETSGCGCSGSGGSGFSVSSEKPLASGGGGCAGSCSSGSCG